MTWFGGGVLAEVSRQRAQLKAHGLRPGRVRMTEVAYRVLLVDELGVEPTAVPIPVHVRLYALPLAVEIGPWAPWVCVIPEFDPDPIPEAVNPTVWSIEPPIDYLQTRR